MYIQVIITDNLLFHYDLPARIPWDGVVMIQTSHWHHVYNHYLTDCNIQSLSRITGNIQYHSIHIRRCHWTLTNSNKHLDLLTVFVLCHCSRTFKTHAYIIEDSTCKDNSLLTSVVYVYVDTEYNIKSWTLMLHLVLGVGWLPLTFLSQRLQWKSSRGHEPTL